MLVGGCTGRSNSVVAGVDFGLLATIVAVVTIMPLKTGIYVGFRYFMGLVVEAHGRRWFKPDLVLDVACKAL